MESMDKKQHTSQTGWKKQTSYQQVHGRFGGCRNTIRNERRRTRRRRKTKRKRKRRTSKKKKRSRRNRKNLDIKSLLVITNYHQFLYTGCLFSRNALNPSLQSSFSFMFASIPFPATQYAFSNVSFSCYLKTLLPKLITYPLKYNALSTQLDIYFSI